MTARPSQIELSHKMLDAMIHSKIALSDAGTGTVKERWSQGDYEISIQGIFIAAENEYPKESVQQLRNRCV